MLFNTGVADVYPAHYGPHTFPMWRYTGMSPATLTIMEWKECCLELLTPLHRHPLLLDTVNSLLIIVANIVRLFVVDSSPSLLSARSDLTRSAESVRCHYAAHSTSRPFHLLRFSFALSVCVWS